MRDRDSNPRDSDSGGDLAISRLMPERRGPERILGINNAGSAGPDCARQRRSHAQRTARRTRAARITRDRRGEGRQGRTPARRSTLAAAAPARRFGRAPLAGRVTRGSSPGPTGDPAYHGCPPAPLRWAAACHTTAAPRWRRQVPKRCTAHGTARHRSKNRTPQPPEIPLCARSPSSEPARPVSSSASA